MAGTLTVRELVTRWGFKADTKAVEKFNKQVDGVKKAAKIATAAVLALSAAAVKITTAFAKTGDEIAKTSRALGIAADEFQRLIYATQIGGASQQEAVVGIRTLSRAINEASQGVAEYKDNFDLLGVSVTDANGNIRPTMDITTDIAEAFSKIENGARKTAIAQELFGRSGYKMINVLSGGAEAFRGVLDEADQYGAVLGKDLLDASETWQDEMLRARTLVRSMGAVLATTLLPELLKLVGHFKEWFGANRALFAQNVEQWVRKVVDAIKALGEWVGNVADAVGDAVKDFGGWNEVWETTKDVLKAIVVIKLAGFIWAAVAAVKGLTLAMSVNPLGALLVAIIAIIAYKDELREMFVGAFDGWAEILNWAIDGLYSFVEGAVLAFQKLVKGIEKILFAADVITAQEYSKTVEAVGSFSLGDRPQVGRVPDIDRMSEEERNKFLGKDPAAPAAAPAAPAAPTPAPRISADKLKEMTRMAVQATGGRSTLSASELARLGATGQLAPRSIEVNSQVTIEVPFGTTAEQAERIAAYVKPVVAKELETAARNVAADAETK